MFNPATELAAAFGDHLAQAYLTAFPDKEAHFADIINDLARETLGLIETCDAPYHDTEHTMMVTLVGQQIIRGKQKTSTVLPEDWLHYMTACLLHDIGFTRGVCEGDTASEVVINDAGERICPPRGATDAYLAPHHVDRGKIYARQRFAGSDLIDPERIAKAIEGTRFPVPDDPAYTSGEGEPALVRAADLIGQIADPCYFRKLSGLYHEFVETGFAEKLGYSSPMDMVEQFPSFFHQQVEPLIGPALDHLRQTPDGEKLISQLYSRVTQVTSGEHARGPFPGPPDET